MTMVHNLPTVSLTFLLMLLGPYEYHYLVVLLLLKFILCSFYFLLLINMAIEIVSIYILWLVAVAVVSYIAGRWKWSDKAVLLDAKLTSLEYSYEKKCRDYDELHDALLRVNKLNKDLNAKLQEAWNTYENCADDMWTMLKMWFSRHGIADKYGISYSTVCYWLRKKEKEMENATVEFHQSSLI